MWIEELANYIRAQNIEGIGESVYCYTLKQNNMGAMLTSHNTGINTINDLPDYYKGVLQIIVRSNNPKDSQTQINAIVSLLNSNERRKTGMGMTLDLTETKFNFILPKHIPVIYPRSDGDFYEASVNFDVCFVALNTI